MVISMQVTSMQVTSMRQRSALALALTLTLSAVAQGQDVESKPVAPPAPVQAAPVQAAPVQAAPVQAAPVQAAPVQAAPPDPTPSASAHEGEGPAGGGTPLLRHVPVSSAFVGVPITLEAAFKNAQSIKRAVALYRTAGDAAEHEVFFTRGPVSYLAVIPAQAVTHAGVSYAVELELTGGERVPAFASREQPFAVQTRFTADDADEKRLLSQLRGKRSVTTVRGEWVDFGRSDALILGTTADTVERVDDGYFRLEASYAYRPLRQVNEFGVRLGLVRGTSSADYVTSVSGRDVGLNYAAPWVRFELADGVYGGGHVLTGVTEVDFSLGAGAELIVGDPYAGNLTLGLESIEDFGSRFYTRFSILASERLILSPGIEASDMPGAGRYGVRLLGEAEYLLTPGVHVAVLGGYQARKAVSGGASFGAALKLEF